MCTLSPWAFLLELLGHLYAVRTGRLRVGLEVVDLHAQSSIFCRFVLPTDYMRVGVSY